MPDRSRILVYPCETLIGEEIHRALRHHRRFTLFGCSDRPGGGRMVYENHLGDLPDLRESDFLPALTQLIRLHKIDFVYPASDDAIVSLSTWAGDSLLDATVIAPGPDVCSLCQSKAATYAYFVGKLRTPRQFRLDEIASGDYPVFVKPHSCDDGGDCHGFVAENRNEVEGRIRDGQGYTLFEYLPGDEYTVDCFTDGQGALLFASGRLRQREVMGVTVDTTLSDEPELRKFADTINTELKLRGPWFCQVKEDKSGRLRLTTIRPRIGAGSSLQRIRGVNLPYLALTDRLGEPFRPLLSPLRRVSLERTLTNRYRLDLQYDAVYMSLDNAIVSRGLVNPDAVRFLFQCHNRGVRTVLLARTLENPDAVLRRHRLRELFDEVVWLRDNEGKSTHIPTRRAILVDDSFAERQEVRENLGIPVFDASALEALLTG
ncbi:MAG: ATP-grasp domain-containing protein [Planctomycetes bacterium]|nr:ATP-grasp domain-containing protein [Planctomycetota bacterium]MCC8116771.1 ATP-grasp domain-containing protein [Planctomycetota bacterium]MCD7897831.1 ATP-grasp domain-containing protein [Planctomycetaceae bacterium]